MENDFWVYLNKLVEKSEIVIDRPKGFIHPRYADLTYPLDYGYLRNSESSDGEGLDIWIGSDPDEGVLEIICTIDLRKNDVEIKAMVGCSDDEVQTILNFHNSGSMRAMHIRRK